MINFFWGVFFCIIFVVFTELDILFFEDYSIKNSKYGEKNLNFHQFIKRSKKSNICKIKNDFRDKFNLFLHCIDYVRFLRTIHRYFQVHIFFVYFLAFLFSANILECAKIANIYNFFT